MHRFLIVIEKAENNYSAYSPDLPGCVATGTTREDVEKKMQEAVKIHIEGMLEDGETIPESHSLRSMWKCKWNGFAESGMKITRRLKR